MPVQQRLPSRRDHPIAFGHRGARAHAPENTLDGFALGLKLGATGLESDAWLTADGVVVLDHDGVVRRGLRRRPIADHRVDDLPAHIPTLAALLERCGDDYELSLDIKQRGIGPAIVEVARAHDPAMVSRLWLCSPSVEELASIREAEPDVRLVNSTRVTAMSNGPERRAANLADLGIDAVNLHHTDWSGGLVTLFHRFERYAFAWDLQFEHLLRPIVRMGIDGVYSDHVDIMIDALAKEA